jgi:hypothetical protein
VLVILGPDCADIIGGCRRPGKLPQAPNRCAMTGPPRGFKYGSLNLHQRKKTSACGVIEILYDECAFEKQREDS